jgi:hypothetical protein
VGWDVNERYIWPRLQRWRDRSEWPVWEVSCDRRDEEEVLEKRLVGEGLIGWIGLVGVHAKGVCGAKSSGFIGESSFSFEAFFLDDDDDDVRDRIVNKGSGVLRS